MNWEGETEDDLDVVPYPEHVEPEYYEDPPDPDGPPMGRVLPFATTSSTAPPAHSGPGIYQGLNAMEIESLPDPRWLIEPYIQEGAFVLFYSDSGIGKSFVALEWALGLATGQLALGQVHSQGAVAYIAAEGIGGYKKRLRAWRVDRQIEDLAGLTFFRGAYNLMNPVVVRDLQHALAALPRRPRLLVIDTLARCAPGADENSAKDMGIFVQGVDQLRLSLECAVLVIHHSGRAGSHERGSTALRAAADIVFSLERKATHLELVCQKQKDFDSSPPASLRLRIVQTAPGETSCVVETPEHPAAQRVTPSALRLLLVLAEGFPAEEPTTSELERAACQPHATFCRNLKLLRDGGYVEAKTGPKRSVDIALTNLGAQTAISAGAVRLLSAPQESEDQ